VQAARAEPLLSVVVQQLEQSERLCAEAADWKVPERPASTPQLAASLPAQEAVWEDAAEQPAEASTRPAVCR